MVGLAQRREVHRTPLRVLIVEDSENDALLLLRALRRGGYEPDYELVQTPEAMRAALSGSEWDVIFSDYRLPRFGAPEALQVSQEAGSRAPFVVVSGKVGEDVAVEMMRAGAHDYVMKDNLARLCATVARGLDEAEERRKLRRAEKELTRRDAILQAVGFAAERFLGDAVGWEESIEAVLAHLGVAAGASRAYIFENYVGEDGELWNAQRYEWTAPGIASGIEEGNGDLAEASLAYRAEGYGRWMEVLGRGEPIHGRTREFPEGEQWALREQDILSIAVVPIFVEGEWWGFLGFDECCVEREWPAAEVDVLKAAASTLGAALRRRRIEEDLLQSEERYRAVIEQATDGIYLLDAATRRLFQTNPSFQKMFGYSAEELRGMEIYDLVAHPRENVDATIERTLGARRRIVGERKYRRKDGSLLDVEVGVSVISLEGRDVICTIVRDVTERKESERRLQEAEFRYRTLVERIPATIYIQMPKTPGEDSYIVAYMSPQVEKILGHPAWRFEEDPKFWNELVHPEDLERMWAETERTDETGEPFGMEYRMLHEDGGYRWVRDEAVLVSDEQGNPLYWQGVFADVTERKRAEEGLAWSENRLRTIIETEPECVKVLGMDGALLEMNPAGLSMIEADSLEQVRGRSVYRYIAPEHRTAFVALTERVLSGGSGTLEFELIGLKGTRRWLDTHAVPLRDAQGGISGLLAITRNITERKRSEEDLRRSEERFRTAFDSAAIGMGLVSPDGFWIRVNQPLCDIVGYSEEEMLGLTFQDITHPDDLEDDLQQVDRLLRGELRAYQMEKRYLHKEGHVVWIRLSVSLMRDGEGVPLYFISQIEDVTQRKQFEEDLKQSEWLYRTVIEQATENIFLVDVETQRIVESNPAFRAALGYTEEELHGMTIYDVVAHDRASVDENLRRVTEWKEPSVGERKYRRKDGSLLSVEVSASVILRGGRATLCAVAHDVTERARAQELLEQRVAALSRISAGLTLDLPTGSTLDALAENVVSASTAVACSVSLIDEEAETVVVAGSHGLPEGYVDGLQDAYRSGLASPTIEAFRTSNPLLVRDFRHSVLEDPLYAPIHRFVHEAPWGSAFFVPLVFRGKALGGINFAYLPGQEPGTDEQVFLKAVADQAAVVVENARLFAGARGKAALEERQRLARELHDSVSQALYGIALGAKTARELADHNPELVADPIEYVLSLAEAGLAEMRALIFELRPESLETEGLVAAIEKQAAALRARHEIEVSTLLCDEPGASPEVKEALYRITQEALHNTVKHARATNVTIKTDCGPDQITLEVSDDGVGFDTEGDFPGHLGLRSMRERALRLGGALQVESSLGRGTRIRAQIPPR